MSISSEHFTSTINKELGYHYCIYLPEDYDIASKEWWPLILFLHGMGERGDEYTRSANTTYVDDFKAIIFGSRIVAHTKYELSSMI